MPPQSITAAVHSALAMKPAHTVNLCGVLSESKRIVNAHSRHFKTLSILFLLPLSCSILIYPTLYLPTSQADIFSGDDDNTFQAPESLIFPLIYTLVAYFLSICALATITHSTFHGFHGRSVRFFSALKSIIYSFFPLVSTAIAAKFIICLISLSFFMFVFVIVKLAQNLGFTIDYSSVYFLWFGALLALGLGLVVLYFQVIWGLAPVIAVTESKWGFEPLWRSSYLVNGMRPVSLSLHLFFGVIIGVWAWMAMNSVLDFAIVEDWKSWDFVLQTIISSSFLSFLTLLLLHYTAANTVLYMYCKALHGELAIEIAEEFAHEYVSLPFDDEKIYHIVNVVAA